MIWIALSVPLMALGVAAAVVPVVWGSVRHHRAETVPEASGVAAPGGTSEAAPTPIPGLTSAFAPEVPADPRSGAPEVKRAA